MPQKIDPLNKKNYTAVTASLCVADVKAAVTFYQKAFGFEKRGMMNGPDGKPVHAELAMRGTVLMLGPEMPQMGARSAKNLGASPTTLYLLVDNVDKLFAKAVKLGATPQGPVADMFWGDRCGRRKGRWQTCFGATDADAWSIRRVIRGMWRRTSPTRRRRR